MSQREPRTLMSRRRFTAVAAGSALLPLAGPLSGGSGDGAAARPTLGSLPDDMTAARPSVPSRQEEAPVGTDALLDYVRALYGDRLDEDDLAVVREEIASYQRASETLRQFPLENADTPAFAFRAWRGADEDEGRG